MNSNSLPWVELYRPDNIDDIKSHESIHKSIHNFLANKTLPHLLFYGPPGTGKTSTIICCAKKLYGEYYQNMILIINASNERGIDTVRTTIKNFVSTRTGLLIQRSDMFRIIVLDEIDSTTTEAQGMLRQTIETYSETARFCLICNDIDKVNCALQSRCVTFRFSLLSNKHVKEKLLEICQDQKINYKNNAIDAIIDISKGDMRMAINTLQHVCSVYKNKITMADIYACTGHCSPKLITNCVTHISTSISENKSISLTVNGIYNIVIENNITFDKFLDKFSEYVIDSSDYSEKQKIYIIDNMAKLEIYDSVNISMNINIMNMISLFVIANKI